MLSLRASRDIGVSRGIHLELYDELDALLTRDRSGDSSADAELRAAQPGSAIAVPVADGLLARLRPCSAGVV
jgi:hypothetical protein